MTTLGYAFYFMGGFICGFVAERFYFWYTFKRKKEEKKLEHVPEPTRTQKIDELIWHRRNLRYHFQAHEISEEDYERDLEFINKELAALGAE